MTFDLKMAFKAAVGGKRGNGFCLTGVPALSLFEARVFALNIVHFAHVPSSAGAAAASSRSGVRAFRPGRVVLLR